LPSTKITESYVLVLQLQKQSVCMALLQSFDNKVIYQAFLPCDAPTLNANFLMDIITPLEKYTIVKTMVGIDDERIAVIPNEIANEDVNKKVIETLQHIDNTEIFLEHTIPWQNYTVLYVAKQATLQLIHSSFKNVTITNTTIACLSNIISHTTQDLDVYITSCATFFALTIFKNKELQLHNTFNYETPIDVLYQITATSKIFEKTQLNIYVNGQHGTEIMVNLKKHFSTVNIMPLPNGLLYLNNDSTENQLMFYQLFALTKLCVS
jgi:Protein of unknown function (DUF3822)